jgi:hypothetical protein
LKKQYLFGYFFARAAKGLALLVILIGIGFCLLEYSQANTSASASAYQPSTSLQRALVSLQDAFSATERIVRAYNTDNHLTTPKVRPLRFPAVIDSNADFTRVGETLLRVDQDRKLLKQSILDRFEAPVKSIEAKLRAYAASLEALPSPTPAVGSSPVAMASPVPLPTQSEESLFSSKLGATDLNKRSADLNARTEFLKVLETKAENPENRLNLTEAVGQLEALSKLLPEKLETSTAPEPTSTASNAQGAEQGRKVFPSERIAAQLEQLRGEVRLIVLTSWTLDDMFEQAADLNSIEREKCRVATLAQKGIWLSAISRVLVGLLVAVLGSFVILVSADLVKTFLDTASHTGVVADAINAMRGSTVIAKSQLRQPGSSDGLN